MSHSDAFIAALDAVPAAAFCTAEDIVQIDSECSLADALQQMRDRGVTSAPVYSVFDDDTDDQLQARGKPGYTLRSSTAAAHPAHDSTCTFSFIVSINNREGVLDGTHTAAQRRRW